MSYIQQLIANNQIVHVGNDAKNLCYVFNIGNYGGVTLSLLQIKQLPNNLRAKLLHAVNPRFNPFIDEKAINNLLNYIANSSDMTWKEFIESENNA